MPLTTCDRPRGSHRIAALLVLLMAAGCAGSESTPPLTPQETARASSINWSHPQQTEIALNEFNFTPSVIVLQVGKPYTFHIVNAGSMTHSMSAPEFFGAVAYADSDTPGGKPNASGTIELPAKKSLDLVLAPLRPGHFPMECTEPMHNVLGMRGEIIVR